MTTTAIAIAISTATLATARADKYTASGFGDAGKVCELNQAAADAHDHVCALVGRDGDGFGFHKAMANHHLSINQVWGLYLAV